MCNSLLRKHPYCGQHIMGFERSGAPKSWRFEVPSASTDAFAALMDRPKDVELGHLREERCI